MTTAKRIAPGERLSVLRKRLAKAIPEPTCELAYEDPWQLLVATILSAQSTDRRVNMTTPELFQAYPGPAALADAERADVERLVRSTGFFRNKAKSIQNMSRMLVGQHGGEVPADMQALLELPGVARKTANLIMGTAFGINSGIVVDTHASRVSQRLELTAEKDPVVIERDLCAVFPKRTWAVSGHRLVLHGRYVCVARKPRCSSCALNEVCPSREAGPDGSWAARARWEDRFVGSRGELDVV